MLHVLFFVTIKGDLHTAITKKRNPSKSTDHSLYIPQAYILIVMSSGWAVLPWYIPPFCVYTLYKVPVDGVRPSTLGMNLMPPHPASIFHVHSPGKGSLSIRRKQLKESKGKRRNVRRTALKEMGRGIPSLAVLISYKKSPLCAFLSELKRWS
ncbi:hypothetical protein GGR55DRAFT_670336 [Xylaria sp. FL0064]|nr:hypothetical protein GGR55DRAFT_670336 [Xylaria sp. FL0064]